MEMHSSQLSLANLVTAEGQRAHLNCKPALSGGVQVYAKHISPQPPSLVFSCQQRLILSGLNFSLSTFTSIIKIKQYARVLIATLGLNDREE